MCCTDTQNTLTLTQALTRIKDEIQPIQGFERVALRSSLGRILAQDIISPVNVPGYANAAMDGYAVKASDLPQEGIQTLHVIGTALAGQAFAGKVANGQCVRIMTGAMIPEGTDTVVMQEHVERDQEVIRLGIGQQAQQHVRLAGEDLAIGQSVLLAGQRMFPPQLGLLASLGIAEIHVKRKLRVAFFSTGDELMSIGEVLKPGHLYDSNRYTLYGMLTRLGVELIDMGVVRDEPEALRQAFLEAANSAEVILTSGGVSVGEADLTKDILAQLGQVHFWKIAMKPGHPLAFGKVHDAVFFGLPGNPVSVMVTFYQLVQPALQWMMGFQQDLPLWQVKCLSKFKKKPGRTEFLRGILEKHAEGEWAVRSAGPQGSGILRSMSEGNCFIVFPAEQEAIHPGDWVDIQMFSDVM